MKHIHIALVGAQAYPVYLGIKALTPSDVILIHSAQSEQDAERIKEILCDSDIVDTAHVQLKQIPTVDIAAVQKDLHQCVEALPSDVQCTVNLTSGTKLWSILLCRELAGRPDVGLVYVDQNCDIYNIAALQSTPSNVSIDMATLFRLYGNEVKSHTILSEYTEEDLAVMRDIKQLRNFNHPVYNSFAVPKKNEWVQKMKMRAGELSDSQGNHIRWNREEGWLEATFYNRRGLRCSRSLESPHAVDLFFSCHWFELQVADILSKWNKAKEVWMNVEFPYKSNLPKNEIDIIVNTGNRLLFVECKTQIPDNTNIDKFSKAVRNYGGMASKALFITESEMKDRTIEKCDQNDVLHFCLKGGRTSELYTLLDGALNEINKR